MLRDFKMIQPFKFEVGDTVYEITRPQQLMVIIRRSGLIYYCRLLDEKSHEIVFMERDLKKEVNYGCSQQAPASDNEIHHQS